MKRTFLVAAALAVASPALVSTAQAHVVCGDRVFPATLVLDDPGVGDEVSFPTVQYTHIPAAAGGGENTSYGFEWDKTITEHFGFAINGDYVVQRSGGSNEYGWDNFSLTLKDEFACSGVNEFAASIGVVREFEHTGRNYLSKLGITDSVGKTVPTIYAGKGMGDILPGYLRPFAVTGEAAFAASDSPGIQPNEWDYGFTLQYSIPYLDQHVKAMGLPEAFTHLVPLVEVSLSSPHGQSTTGTYSPGILYEGDTWQVGIEANIPVNHATWQSQGIGFIAQFHLFLDDIFPESLGKPIF
jgi:hypothetical protein